MICSSFNKLWFCKKQVKEIARELLLHEVLCFSEKHILLTKVYWINQNLLYIFRGWELGMYSCWKICKARQRSHHSRSWRPVLKSTACRTKADGSKGFVRKCLSFTPVHTSTTTASGGRGGHGICSITFQVLCGCFSQANQKKGILGFGVSSFPLWCSGDLRRHARLTKI